MSRISSKIELTANLLIIVVAILLGVVLVQKYLVKKPANADPPSRRVQPEIGSKVKLTDVNWTQQPKTLVLALQTECHFCNESAPFYKRVIESVRDKRVKLVAVFPTGREESAAHLKELGLADIEVRQASLDSLHVSGTPTLILTNDKGEITNYWVGRLSPNLENEVLAHLQ